MRVGRRLAIPFFQALETDEGPVIGPPPKDILPSLGLSVNKFCLLFIFKESKNNTGGTMGRKRKKEENGKERKEHDSEYWANKTDELIASLPIEGKDLTNFFWPIIDDTIDQRTNNIKLFVLSREVEQVKYKDEIWLKFAKETRDLGLRWINMVLGELNSYIKARDSPKEI